MPLTVFTLTMVPIDPAGTVSLPSCASAPPALTMTVPLVGPALAT